MTLLVYESWQFNHTRRYRVDTVPEFQEGQTFQDKTGFDFDKWNIKPEAAAELDRLVGIMKENPTMRIAATSHTDERGTTQYNMTLSERRAKSMRDYVISKGIAADRIAATGKGETEPAVDCGANCTEEEHQLNRRSEFVIVNN